jgi:hypothetical protein
MRRNVRLLGLVCLLLWFAGVSGLADWGLRVNWTSLIAGVALIALSARLRT